MNTEHTTALSIRGRRPFPKEGDLIVSRRTARADVYAISVVPDAAHLTTVRFQEAISTVVEARALARGRRVVYVRPHALYSDCPVQNLDRSRHPIAGAQASDARVLWPRPRGRTPRDESYLSKPVLFHLAPERDGTDFQCLGRLAPVAAKALERALDHDAFLLLQIQAVAGGS